MPNVIRKYKKHILLPNTAHYTNWHLTFTNEIFIKYNKFNANNSKMELCPYNDVYLKLHSEYSDNVMSALAS